MHAKSAHLLVEESNRQVTARRAEFGISATPVAESSDFGPERQAVMGTSKTKGFMQAINLRIAMAIALLAALVLAGSLTAPFTEKVSAQTGQSKQEAVFGTVLEVTPPDTISVMTDAGTVKLLIRASTKFIIGTEVGRIENVAPGDKVVATATRLDDVTFSGVNVLIRAGENSQPITKHIVGTVVDAADGQVTIQTRDGDKITVAVPAGIVPPEIGAVVTTVATLDRATQRLLAKIFERAENVVDRIQAAADNAGDAETAQRLKELADEARQSQLSALEEAKRSLERARQQVAEAQDQARKAGERLKELEEKLRKLNDQYKAEAKERGEQQPHARVKGAFTDYEAQGPTFSIRTNESELKFAYDDNTRASGIAVTEEGVEVIICDPCSNNGLPLLKDVLARIPAGASVIVEYEVGAGPPLAVGALFVEPGLPKEIKDALDESEKGFFVGTITLVEKAQEDGEVVGLIVVADETANRKAVARITEDTEIVVDGKLAGFDDLAVGQKTEVRFDDAVVRAATGAAAAAAKGILDAVAVRARNNVDEDAEVKIAGIIRDIFPEQRVIVVVPRDGGPVKVHVDDDAKIQKDGAPARFAALRAGDLVLDATRYDRLAGEAERLVVLSPRDMDFAGVITGIEAAKIELPAAAATSASRMEVVSGLKVTVNRRDGERITVLVTRETKLLSRLSGGISAGDLKVGDVIVSGQMRTVEVNGTAYNLAVSIIIGAAEIDTVRGVVAKVDAGSGTLVVEVPGSRNVELHVPVPASNASMIKNELPIETLRPVEAGDVVENATFETKGNTILKLSVVSANTARVSGQVAKIDAAAGTLVISNREDSRGVDLRVSGDTKIRLNGRDVQTFGDMATGDTAGAIYVTDAGDKSKGLALVVQVFSRPRNVTGRPGDKPTILPGATNARPPTVEITVAGKIEVIEGDTWVIADKKFQVSGQTQLFGEKPQVGLVAKASLRTDENGVLTAIAVSVAGRPDDKPTTNPVDVRPVDPSTIGRPDVVGTLVRVSGVIEATDGRSVVLGGVKFLINEQTKLSGTPQAGFEAKAILLKRPDGSVVAVELSIGGKVDQPAARPTPKPAVTPTSSGDLQKLSGRLADGAENVIVIGTVKCEVRPAAFLALLRRLNVTARELGDYVRKNEVSVVASARGALNAACVIEQMEVTVGPGGAGTGVATPPATSVPVTATPRVSGGGGREKIAARIDALEGRVWKIGDRIVIVPPKVRAEVKAGSAVTVVVQKIDRERLKEWLDEATLKEVLSNSLYLSLLLRANVAVYIVEEVQVTPAT